MNKTFPNINTLWASVFVDELARAGVRHAVISPGSRSTPLTLALAEHPDIADHSVIDERSAGFFALGLAKATRNTVALLCTSGTAAATFLPAVCEADASEVPLLVLTADRPAHLRDCGAPQTMEQIHLFGARVRWFHDVAQPEADEPKLRYLRATACHAVRASQQNPGPVHLNFPFRKPLEPIVSKHAEEIKVEDAGIGCTGRDDGRAYARTVSGPPACPPETIRQLYDLLCSHPRILLVAGPDEHGADYRDALRRFTEAVHVPAFAETLSQQRFQSGESKWLIDSAPLFLRDAGIAKDCQPDLMIHLGGTATSKVMLEFIAHSAQAEHVFISAGMKRQNPDHLSSWNIRAHPADALNALSALFEAQPRSAADGEWNGALDRLALQAGALRAAALKRNRIVSSAVAAHHLLNALPDRTPLFVSSSMPVRDLELFSSSMKKDIPVYCNRGMNGIDGVTSTALGLAKALKRRTVLLTGDVAFLHDLNALSIAARKGIDATIVVLNNNGGEIFSTLPVRDCGDAFTKHFTTPHGVDFSAAAQMFGVGFIRAKTVRAFDAALAEAQQATGVTVIEAVIDMNANTAERERMLHESIPAAPHTIQAPASPSHSFRLVRHCLTEGKERGASPVLFLHGFTRSAASWRALLPGLGVKRTLLAVDLMGHGASPAPDFDEHPAAYAIEHQSEQIEAIIRRTGSERVHLVGYSMGGRTALHYATQHPETLASLTLISASPGIESRAARVQRKREDDALAETIMIDGLEAFVEAWTSSGIMADGESADQPDHAYSERISQWAQGLAGSLRGMGQGAQPSFWKSLKELRVPTLLIAGERDSKYSEIMRRMAARIRGSRVEIITGMGHDCFGGHAATLSLLLEALWDHIESNTQVIA